MNVDSNPFPFADVNMVSAAPDKGKGKVGSSKNVAIEVTPMIINSLKPNFTNKADLAAKLCLLCIKDIREHNEALSNEHSTNRLI